MLERGVEVQPLELRLFAARHHIDVVTAAQTMIEDIDQAVGIRRVIDPDNVRPALQYVVDESGGLVAETVVVISPGMAADQNVQGCQGSSPGKLAALL